MIVRLFDGLIGLLLDWLIDWWIVWFSWLRCLMVGWLIERLVSLLIVFGCLFTWLIDSCMACFDWLGWSIVFIVWLVGCADWSMYCWDVVDGCYCLIDWLMIFDWLISCLMIVLMVGLVVRFIDWFGIDWITIGLVNCLMGRSIDRLIGRCGSGCFFGCWLTVWF